MRVAQLLYGVAEAAWLMLLVALPTVINPLGGMVVEPVKASLLRYLAALAGMTWACGRLLGASGGRAAGYGPVGLASLAWLGASSLSTLFSLNPAVSFFGSYERGMGLLSLAAGPLLLTGGQIFADARRRERALTALVLGAVIPCLYALVQYLGRDPLHWAGVEGLVSSLGSPTFLAGYLVLVTPFALYRTILAGLSLSRGGGGLRAAWYALHLGLLLLTMAVIVLSAIRGALVGLAAATGVYAVLVARAASGQQRRLVVAVIGLLVGVALVLAALSSGGPPGVLQRFLEIASPSGSAQARLAVWQAAIPLPFEHPKRVLLGFGPEMQGTVFERSRSIVETSTSERWDRAHNLLIDTWVTSGALGLGTLLLVVVTATGRLWRKVSSADTWQESLLPATVLAALVGHLAEQCFSFHSVVTGAWFWVVLTLGCSLDAPGAEPPRPPLTRVARLGLGGVAASLAVVSLPVLAAPAVADNLHGIAIQAQRQGALRAAALAAERAAAWAPWEEQLPRLAGIYWQALAFRSEGAAADELFGRAEAQFVEAIRRNPFDPYAHLRLARHELAWAVRSSVPGRQAQLAEKAARACAQALALGPYRPAIQQGCAAGELAGE